MIENKELMKLESELTKLIIDKNDPELLNKFFKWQDERKSINANTNQ